MKHTSFKLIQSGQLRGTAPAHAGPYQRRGGGGGGATAVSGNALQARKGCLGGVFCDCLRIVYAFKILNRLKPIA